MMNKATMAVFRRVAATDNASFIGLPDCGITRAFVLPKKRFEPPPAVSARPTAVRLGSSPAKHHFVQARPQPRPRVDSLNPARITAKFCIAAMNALIDDGTTRHSTVARVCHARQARQFHPGRA